MKAKVSFLVRLMAVSAILFVTSTLVFADGDITETYLSGSTNSAAGGYVVQTSGDMFYYNGNEYEVYTVSYDNPEMDMKIAVNDKGLCHSYVAYSDKYMFFYYCTKDGFGVRKVLFSNPDEHNNFDPVAYQKQTILRDKRKLDKKEAIGLIVCFVPDLRK